MSSTTTSIVSSRNVEYQNQRRQCQCQCSTCVTVLAHIAISYMWIIINCLCCYQTSKSNSTDVNVMEVPKTVNYRNKSYTSINEILNLEKGVINNLYNYDCNNDYLLR